MLIFIICREDKVCGFGHVFFWGGGVRTWHLTCHLTWYNLSLVAGVVVLAVISFAMFQQGQLMMLVLVLTQ